MRISAKGRYALASMTHLAMLDAQGEHITVASISEALGISKIYLEQVFAQLKQGGVVRSIKGAQGGYELSRAPGRISAYEILSCVETSLFESTESATQEKAPHIDEALASLVYDTLDNAILERLRAVTIDDVAVEAVSRRDGSPPMFYI